jgi:hypothetical protein
MVGALRGPHAYPTWSLHYEKAWHACAAGMTEHRLRSRHKPGLQLPTTLTREVGAPLASAASPAYRFLAGRQADALRLDAPSQAESRLVRPLRPCDLRCRTHARSLGRLPTHRAKPAPRVTMPSPAQRREQPVTAPRDQARAASGSAGAAQAVRACAAAASAPVAAGHTTACTCVRSGRSVHEGLTCDGRGSGRMIQLQRDVML